MEVIKTIPDAELLQQLREGKKTNEMVRYLYREHYGLLSHYVLQNQGRTEDAEDMFQEVIVSFIDQVQKNRFRGESSVKTYLYSLNRYTWLNELKRRGRAEAREERYEKRQEQLAPDAFAQLADRESRLTLQQLLEELGESCRTILLLFYYENRPMKEILQATNYENEQVVRNKKYKCLRQLEQLLEARPALRENLKNLLDG